jgi:3-hydroxyisobutyrate dehydrogenase-like beta-hydroxyacid dehydrogenase
MKVAVLGLGIIGSQWVKHLDSDGILSAAWNRSVKKDAPRYTSDVVEAAASATVVHLCLADPPAVRSTLEAVRDVLRPDHLVIQSSTIDPTSASEFQALVTATGASYVEAPFTGSLPAAQARELVFYVGASDPKALRVAKEYLARLSKKIIEIGSERQAATIKLAMNLQIAAVMQALAEALTLSRSAEIPDDLFFEAFRLNASFSGVAALKENKLRAGDFSPQFSVKHMAKDLRLLKAECATAKAPFLTELQSIFADAIQQGFSEDDYASLIRLLA